MPDFAPLQRYVADSLVNRGIPSAEAERAAVEAERTDTTNTIFGLFRTAWAIAQRNASELEVR